jgi:hypothetical protein
MKIKGSHLLLLAIVIGVAYFVFVKGKGRAGSIL